MAKQPETLDLVKTEAWELSEYETAHIPAPVIPIQWSVEKYKAAQMLALSGKNQKEVAADMNLPLALIKKWAGNLEFQQYMQGLIEEYAKALKTNRLMVLNKILAARIEQAEQEGYGDLSRKDTVDIIAEIRKETGDSSKAAEAGYMNLLEKLIDHSISNMPQTIQVEGKK